MSDTYDLLRFEQAQDEGGTYEAALDELRRGRKAGHWIWFVFPQLTGLGMSANTLRYALGSLDEAAAYLTHPVLGPRLRQCCEAVLAVEDLTAEQVLGDVDAVKLRSSMTLFLRAEPDDKLFQQVLDHWYDGRPDPRTDALLAGD